MKTWRLFNLYSPVQKCNAQSFTNSRGLKNKASLNKEEGCGKKERRTKTSIGKQ